MSLRLMPVQALSSLCPQSKDRAFCCLKGHFPGNTVLRFATRARMLPDADVMRMSPGQAHPVAGAFQGLTCQFTYVRLAGMVPAVAGWENVRVGF